MEKFRPHNIINMIGSEPPKIWKSLSRSFSQTDNVLLMHTPSMLLSKALAHALYHDSSYLIILVDADDILLKEINYYLHLFKTEHSLDKNDVRADKPEAINLSKTVKEKRKKLYLEGGIYCLSLQIAILDLMSHENVLNPQRVERLVLLHDGRPITDAYCHHAWLATLLSLNNNQTKIVMCTEFISKFKADRLQNAVRLMLAKKVVVWPFGRTEIVHALKAVSLNATSHKLLLNSHESTLHSLYNQLLKLCAGSMLEKSQIQRLQHILTNQNKLCHLEHLTKVMEESPQWSIWNKCNSHVLQIISNLTKVSRNCVYNLLLCQAHKRPINLNQLIGQRHQQTDSPSQHYDEQQKNGREELKKEEEAAGRQQSESMGQRQDGLPKSDVIYQLSYELVVDGLRDCTAEELDCPFYSPKFVELIKFLQGRYASKQGMGQRQLNETVQKDEENGYVQLSANRNQGHKPVEEASPNEQQEKSVSVSPKEQQDRPTSVSPKEQMSPKEKMSPKEQVSSKEKMPPKEQQDRPGSVSVYIGTRSMMVGRSISEAMGVYEKKIGYLEQMRRVQKFLQGGRRMRMGEIKKIMRREGGKSTGNKFSSEKIRREEEEIILLEELHQELCRMDEILIHHSSNQLHEEQDMFQRELRQAAFRYLDPTKLPGIGALRGMLGVQESGNRVYKVGHTEINLTFQKLANKYEFMQHMRVLAPQLCIFYSPNPVFIRSLSIACAQSQIIGPQELHAFYFEGSPEAQEASEAVKEEDQNFWQIAQDRNKLADYCDKAELRVKQLIINDELHKKAAMVNLAQGLNPINKKEYSNLVPHWANPDKLMSIKVERTILIDKREFKSSLPSFLFHHGFKVVPVFLDVGDYILSNDIAVEKKSVHTHDLHESLRSGRLFEQCKKMVAKFRNPVLLIECPDKSYFTPSHLNSSLNKVTGERYKSNTMRQLTKLMATFPKMGIIWTQSYLETVQLFVELKKDELSPQLNRFKPQGEYEEIEEIEETVTVSRPGRNNDD